MDPDNSLNNHTWSTTGKQQKTFLDRKKDITLTYLYKGICEFIYLQIYNKDNYNQNRILNTINVDSKNVY